MLNDLGEATKQFLSVNFNNMTVSNIVSKGSIPTPRAMHKMLKIKEDIILLYGGTGNNEEYFKQNMHTFLDSIYIYYVKDCYWAQPIIGGNPPDGRFDFALSCKVKDLYIR